MTRLSLLTKTETNDLVVNIGRTANDRSGDPLRTAFDKLKQSVNNAESNFVELYSAIGADVQIPVQTNNGGKFLTTNGTTLSWVNISQEVGTANTGFSNDKIYNINGPTLSNDDLVHGPTARLSLPAYGDTENPISLYNNYGNFSILVGPSGTITNSWTFNSNGNLTLPANGTISNTNTISGPSGTSYTFADNGSTTPGIDNSNVVYLDNTLDAQAIQAGWVITFANSTQKTVTLADIGLPPNAGKRMLQFADNVTLTGTDVWPLTVQSADYNSGVNITTLEITPEGTTTWALDSTGVLTLPAGGDIVDSTGTSVLGAPAVIDGGNASTTF